MKKSEALVFVNKFKELDNIEDFDFSLIMVENYLLLKNETEGINILNENTDEYNLFVKEGKTILMNNVEKDKDDKPIIDKDKEGNEFFRIKDTNTLKKESLILEKKYKSTIEYRIEKDKRIKEELNKNIKSKIIMVNKKTLPKTLNPEQLRLILGMINFNK